MKFCQNSANEKSRSPGLVGDLAPRWSAARRGLSAFQWIAVLLGVTAAGWLLWRRPTGWLEASVAVAGGLFLFVSAWRCLLIVVGRLEGPPPPEPEIWPRYTVLAALYDEAEVVGQLIRRLAVLDYPADRLQGFLVLEAHDAATQAAAAAVQKPDWLEVFVVPPGKPGTKPRALNHALNHATGDLVTVYDAEDAPDPGQLKEAAARFVADGGGRLACLQAPLRIRVPARSASPFIDRQFAAEYASLFETALPGLARLGLPFPLGGTSNHFRVDVLRAIGGWDSWNVTEDADLGFRLWRMGWRAGVIRRPTWETPPGHLYDWLPQRTRWLKGYLQTLGVHTRSPIALGPRGLFALVMTLGVALASAALYGPTLSWVLATVLVAGSAGLVPDASKLAVSVLVLGASAAWLSCAVGARRAGIPYRPQDMIAAPAYWCLLSLAFTHAFWRLLVEPFAWDKTRHRAENPPAQTETTLDEAGSHRLSASHAATSEPVA